MASIESTRSVAIWFILFVTTLLIDREHIKGVLLSDTFLVLNSYDTLSLNKRCETKTKGYMILNNRVIYSLKKQHHITRNHVLHLRLVFCFISWRYWKGKNISSQLLVNPRHMIKLATTVQICTEKRLHSTRNLAGKFTCKYSRFWFVSRFVMVCKWHIFFIP